MMSSQLRVAVVQFAPKVSTHFLGDENSNHNRTSSTLKLGQVQANIAKARELCNGYAASRTSTFEDGLTAICKVEAPIS